MKSVGMTDPKSMATFIALGGNATASWFKRKSLSPGLISKTPSRTWCIKLNPSNAVAFVCQNYQLEYGYIQIEKVRFEELKQLFMILSCPI